MSISCEIMGVSGVLPCSDVMLVAVQGVVATVKQCLFDTNLADFGGGIFRGSTNGDISGNVFQNNRAVKIGGAIYDSHSQVGPQHAVCSS